MIGIKPLKDEATKLPEPLKSIVEMQKNTMQNEEFVNFFIALRRKAREIDSMEAQK